MKKIISVILILTIIALLNPVAAQNRPSYEEPFRPQYHYSPPCRWMNDPNGLVYFDGEYHLFYQFNPDGVVWGPMHWGHAVSRDLVHWETLPIALNPDENGTIFSGSAVIDADNTAGFGPNAMIAVYSYDKQSQGVAYSLDRGRTWTKYSGNPVIEALAKDFRDPKVFWNAATKQWIMVISAGHEVRIFTSPNLLKWVNTSKFTGGNNLSTWEVPDLFPMQIDGKTKWVLLVSTSNFAPAGGGGIQYFIGDFDGSTFTSDNPSSTFWLDYGPDNYAGTTWNNEPNNKRIYIGWMNNWEYADHIPTSTWRGATTIPRELSLINTAKGLRLVQVPIPATSTLRTLLHSYDNLAVGGDTPIPDVHGRTLEIQLDFDPGTAQRFGIDVQRGADARTHIVYNTKLSQLLIGRATVVGNDNISGFSPAFGAPLTIENNRLHLDVFVDESSVEVFANGGLVTITSQTFVNPQNGGLAVFAEGGTATLTHMDVYSMQSVWKQATQTPTPKLSFCS